jgi:hypothetical protein
MMNSVPRPLYLISDLSVSRNLALVKHQSGTPGISLAGCSGRSYGLKTARAEAVRAPAVPLLTEERLEPLPRDADEALLPGSEGRLA